ncbi:MAG TPA: hypothetical protein PLM81_01725 [Ginsengibacter sp.]|nr:hypothetical protein [Ginsengibacter sp.]HRP16353.1 hypothetical protein [Ginsengibacter sp.]HRP43651.1 hypothetical protein [Ginsengibacter sp.]
MENVEKKVFDTAVKEFARKMNASKDKTVTTAVGFDSKKLLKWLKKVAPVSSEVQVRFGIYNKKSARSSEEADRVTVFFMACDENGDQATDENGEPVDPVNAGNIYP